MKQLQESCESGIVDEYTKCMIVDMSKKVVSNLLGKVKRKYMEEGVN